jgi:hypothetical protein
MPSPVKLDGGGERGELALPGDVAFVEQRHPDQFITGLVTGGYWPEIYKTADEARSAVESRLQIATEMLALRMGSS